MRFFCSKKSAYYRPGRVCHQFTGEFGILLPPPEDMASQTATYATAHLLVATALGGRSRYTIREADQEGYLEWFQWVGWSYLFPEELRES